VVLGSTGGRRDLWRGRGGRGGRVRPTVFHPHLPITPPHRVRRGDGKVEGGIVVSMQLPDALNCTDRATQRRVAAPHRGGTIYKVARRLPAEGSDVYDTVRRLRASQSNGPNLHAIVDLDSICAYAHLQLELAPDAWDPRSSPLQLNLNLDLDATLHAIGRSPDQMMGWLM
jgi:hypothetical protein